VAIAVVARAIPLYGGEQKAPPPGARKRLTRAAALPVVSALSCDAASVGGA